MSISVRLSSLSLRSHRSPRIILPLFFLVGHLLLLSSLSGQTLYTVVLGNQGYVVGSSTLKSGLFVSHDTGRSWRHLGPENLKAYSMDGVDRTNGERLYIAAGNGVHRSTDLGQSWKIVTPPDVNEVLDIKIDQKDPDYLYAATAFGLWYSEDGGDSWKKSNSLAGDIYCYHVRYLSNDSIVVVTSGKTPDAPHPVVKVVRPEKEKAGIAQRSIQDAEVRNEDPNGCEEPLWGEHCSSIAGPDPYFFPCAMLDTSHVVRITSAGILLAGSTGITWLHCPDTDEAGTSPQLTPLSIPLPSSRQVHDLALFDGGNGLPILFAGTFGEGMFRWDGNGWNSAGLSGSQVWSVIVKAYRVPEKGRRIGRVESE